MNDYKILADNCNIIVCITISDLIKSGINM